MEKLTPKEEVKIMYGIFVMRYKRIESNTFIPGNMNTTEMAMAADMLFETEQKAIDFLPIMKKLEDRPKANKMQAYKKSGKQNRYFLDEDDDY